VYGTVDFDDVSGTASVVLPGKNNQTGVALGLRTIFQVPHGTARHVTPGIHAGRRPRKWRAHKKGAANGTFSTTTTTSFC
jgi:hypothetical protein